MRYIKGSTGKNTYWISGNKAVHKPRLWAAPSKATTKKMTEEDWTRFYENKRKRRKTF